MGNKNCTTWNSILFPESEEEERLDEWLNSTNSMTWEYTPSLQTGTEVLPVQPVYKPDVRELQFRHENEKINSLRKRRYLFKEKDSTSKHSEEDLEVLRDRSADTNGNIPRLEKKAKTKQHEEKESETTTRQNPKRRFPTGRVYISISHDPITRRIKVAVIKAKNLSCKQTGPKDKCGINCAASFMDVSLYEGEQVRQSYTTAIKKGYSEVLYYENFAFDTNNLDLRAVSLEITAKHSHKQHFINHSHDIGKTVLEGQMNEDTMIDSHLVEAIVHPGHTLYKWHTLWT